MAKERRPALSAGFTLLEMIAAMAMIAVVAGSLYAAMHMSFFAKKQSEAILAPLRAADALFESMSRDLQCSLPPRGILAGPFLGQADSMSFFTRMINTRDAAPGIAGVEYLVLQDQEREFETFLARNVRINLLSLEEEEPFEERLAYGVSSMEIRYFDGSAWLDSWDSTTMGDILPAAVDVSVEIDVKVQGKDDEPFSFRRVFLLACHAPVSEETLQGAVSP
ncbi:MAG TPA: type II secretion system protein GspJ [bacterium]|nr:type II secretion system protein GspJ [bacterium]